MDVRTDEKINLKNKDRVVHMHYLKLVAAALNIYYAFSETSHAFFLGAIGKICIENF